MRFVYEIVWIEIIQFYDLLHMIRMWEDLLEETWETRHSPAVGGRSAWKAPFSPNTRPQSWLRSSEFRNGTLESRLNKNTQDLFSTDLNKYRTPVNKCLSCLKPTIRILPVFESLLVLNQSIIRLSSHGLGQVTECLWIIKVQFLCTWHGRSEHIQFGSTYSWRNFSNYHHSYRHCGHLL